MWRSLQNITNYRRPAPHTTESHQLANNLNVFYCRYEKPTFTPPNFFHNITQTAPSTLLELFHFDTLSAHKTCEKGNSSERKKQPASKFALTNFTPIYNRSLELYEVFSCFKNFTIILILKSLLSLDYIYSRFDFLTSVVLKSFKKVVLTYLKDFTDPLQFAYQANRSVVGDFFSRLQTFLKDRKQQIRLGKNHIQA